MHINLDNRYVTMYKYPSLLKEILVFSLIYYSTCSNEFLYYICVWGHRTHSWSLESRHNKNQWMWWENVEVLRMVSSNVFRRLDKLKLGVMNLVFSPWQKDFADIIFTSSLLNMAIYNLETTPYFHPLCIFISL